MQQVGIDFVTKGEREAERAIRAVGREVDNLTKKSINASTASQRLEAQRKRETQELERLRGKYVQGYTAMQMYSKELNDLAKARRAGIISSQQQAAEVARLNAAMESGSFAARGMGDANHIASRKTNAFGMATQQAGYQVGDFLVQIQGGTNAFVAFGQQATQLVGILPMLAGQFGMNVNRLIAISAGLGIAIPLATALGAAFMRTREGADEASDGVQTFEEKLKSARSEVQSIADDLELMRLGFKNAFEKTLTDQVTQAEKKLKAAREQLDTLEKRGPTAADQTGEGVRRQAESVLLAERAVALAVTELESAKELVRQKKEQERNDSVRNQLHESRIIIAEREKDLQESILDVVDDVLHVMEESKDAAYAIDFSNAIASANGLLGVMSRISGVLGGIMGQIGSIGFENIGKQAQARALEAGRSVAQANIEGQLAQERARLESGVLGQGGIFGEVAVNASILAKRKQLEEGLRLDETIAGFSKTGGSGGGSGSRGADPVEELKRAQKAVDQLRASYDEQFATSLKVAEAQEKVNELIRLNPDLTDQANQILQDYVKSLERAKNPMEELAQTMRKSMSDAFMSIVDGTSSAEDAFRNMARAILKQAFELMVIKPIMDSLFGAQGGSGGSGLIGKIFGFEKGGAFNNGNVIPFANGGVVSSPTMFPMAGSQTGLMGEAGPEAIMPLKRGKGGKLGVVAEGGGGNVTVENHFHIAANGDESVKRIIAQEAPRIANLTQKQIIDQRRRGGNLKAAFG